MKLCMIKQSMLLEFSFDKTDCKSCGINRYIQLFEEIRYCTYMILMTVGYEQSFYFISIFLNKSKIRNY